LRIDEQLALIVGQIGSGRKVVLTPRELLSRLGFKRRGSNVVADVKSALARHSLETQPDFAELDYESPFEIIYTESIPAHQALLQSAREAADAGRPAPSLTVRDFLRKFGQERRGFQICKQVNEALEAQRLTTLPSFETAGPESYIKILDAASSNDFAETGTNDDGQLRGLIESLESHLVADALSEGALDALFGLAAKINQLRHYSPGAQQLVSAEIVEESAARGISSPRFEPDFEYALIKLLAEVVMADGVAFANEDEAAATYILDHVASDSHDAERLIQLYSECKYDEIELEDIRDYLIGATLEDREALFDACVKIAWADGDLDESERDLLRKICSLLDIDESSARTKVASHGETLKIKAASGYVYTHVETVEIACGPVEEIPQDITPEWIIRSLQLQAISTLLQKRAARISITDDSWRKQLGDVDQSIVVQALSGCRQLQETSSGYIPSDSFRAPGPHEPSANEATLFRLLLGQGSPLTARFLSFRMQPPKVFSEADIRRIAQDSPALTLYKLGTGNWLGARLWGKSGALQVARDDWAMIKRDLVKSPPQLTDFEWEAVLEQAEATGQSKIASLAEIALDG